MLMEALAAFALRGFSAKSLLRMIGAGLVESFNPPGFAGAELILLDGRRRLCIDGSSE